jgi:hypothetical protein
MRPWAALSVSLVMALLVACSTSEEGADTPARDGLFVVVSIPEGLNPLERGAKYEEPLHAALHAQGLGEVSGGGTRLGPAKPDGGREITAIDIDVELVDAERGLPALRDELRKLNPPAGTRLTYEGENGDPVEEPL